MIVIPSYQNKTVVIVGLGRTGLSAAHALKASGANVMAWDDLEESRNQAQAQGITIDLLEHIHWDQVSALILSPGIPHLNPQPHPAANYARQHQIPILCDIDLLAQAYPQAKYIGITGTNGKSTTTSLIGHLLQAACVPSFVGGNIGTPVLELDPLPKDGRYILELSSYQLERSPHLNVDTVVWLNITPDHLERHGSLQDYVAAKAQIFKPKGEPQKIAIGIDDPESARIYEQLCQDASKEIVPVSITRELSHGVFVRQGALVDTYFSKGDKIDFASLPRLKGLHNWQNVALAYAALHLESIPFREEALQSFKGMPHRQELCGLWKDIQFINDSKATNIDSTLKALSSYEGIYLILGGLPKESMLDGIEAYKDRIQGAYLIGQAEGAFAEILDRWDIPYKQCAVLSTAVENSIADAQESTLPSKTILLSPACASFDQFKNFEERGKHFKDLVSAFMERSSLHTLTRP